MHDLTRVCVMSRAAQGTGNIINLIFRFNFCILFLEVSGMVWPFVLSQIGWLVYINGMLGFLLGCDTSPLSWKISLDVLSLSQKSTSFLRLLAANSNPCTSNLLLHPRVRENLTSLIFLSSGNFWSFPKGVKCLIYSTI